MDTFVCSSWYAMRYPDPHNTEAPFGKELADYWLPVDMYTGGAEHAVMHLLYVRFFWKAARDMGLVHTDEPMNRLFNQGVILGPDGNRMSKSRGNVVAPDELVERYGADALRCQLMFVGPWDQGGPYNPTGMQGIVRWLNRMWSLVTESPRFVDDEASRSDLRKATHVAIREVSRDIEDLRWNTLIARLMEHSTSLARLRDEGPVDRQGWEESIEAMMLLAAPLAPHITEELWERSGRGFSVHSQQWPVFDEAHAQEDAVQIVVQVNGKVRDRLSVAVTASEKEVTDLALSLERVREFLGGRQPRKVIFVPGKLVNIVG
jgi:leucyl-tRNA synthetase